MEAETPAKDRLIDEDAFGLLFSYYDVEDDEYGCDEREEFVARFEAFERGALEIVSNLGLPPAHHVLCLGHAVYVELRDGEDAPELLRSARAANAQLSAAGFVNVTVLSHGSRWVLAGEAPELSVAQAPEQARIARISRPSEPLRRALDVVTLSRRDELVEGWGPGVYVDTEALEALGKVPKNAPTVLQAPGAQFFRIPPIQPEAR